MVAHVLQIGQGSELGAPSNQTRRLRTLNALTMGMPCWLWQVVTCSCLMPAGALVLGPWLLLWPMQAAAALGKELEQGGSVDRGSSSPWISMLIAANALL